MPPTVTVVIPAYNAARWIGETLESVFSQRYDDYEVIVVDDGSTDHTAEVVAQFPRARCIRKENGRQASARNVGIRHASGKYIAFLDADDLWFPEKLQAQVALLEKTGLAWVYSDVAYFDSQTRAAQFLFSRWFRLYEGDIAKQLLLACFIPSPTVVVKRTVFEEVGFFNESRLLHNRDDWEMWLRIAARYPVGVVRRPLAGYRVHATSGSAREDPALVFASELAVVEMTCAREPRLLPLRRQALAYRCISVANRLVGRGRTATACSFYRRAFQLWPHPRTAFLWLASTLDHPLLPHARTLSHRTRALRSSVSGKSLQEICGSP